jgi:hypothetical protein
MAVAANTRDNKRTNRRLSEERVDRALWSAYQLHDKRAVTKQLLRRYLQAPRKGGACDRREHVDQILKRTFETSGV